MNITLIGMCGVGKSVIGKQLAKKLGFRFVDVDDLIEEQQQIGLQKIIDNHGNKGFIEAEEKAILSLSSLDNCIFTPGGSVVYSEKAMEFLQNNSQIIFLNDTLNNIQKRVENKESRGILGFKEKGLDGLYHERLPLYKKYSGLTISMPEDFNIGVVVNQIISEVTKSNHNLF